MRVCGYRESICTVSFRCPLVLAETKLVVVVGVGDGEAFCLSSVLGSCLLVVDGI